MKEDNSTTERIDEVCPICRTTYQTSKELPAPTCGHPNCIREARERGLPITPQLPLPVPEPSPVIKPKKDKARKSRS